MRSIKAGTRTPSGRTGTRAPPRRRRTTWKTWRKAWRRSKRSVVRALAGGDVGCSAATRSIQATPERLARRVRRPEGTAVGAIDHQVAIVLEDQVCPVVAKRIGCPRCIAARRVQHEVAI